MDVATKARRGQKWTCFDCETKFYDLNSDPPVCPKCGTDQNSAPPVPKVATKKVKKRAPKRKARARPLKAPPESGADVGEQAVEVELAELDAGDEIGTDD